MSDLNRFEWYKAILQLTSIPSSTKAVAGALAIEFANDKTGKICPSQETLAAYLNLSVSTVKRAIRQMVQMGWLTRTEGRGAGNTTHYNLVAPGKIVRFSKRQKRSQLDLCRPDYGSLVNAKVANGDPSYEEQYFKQKRSRGLSEAVFVSQGSFMRKQWDQFCEKMFGTDLSRLVPACSRGGETGYLLPDRFPPHRQSDQLAYRQYLIDSGVVCSESAPLSKTAAQGDAT